MPVSTSCIPSHQLLVFPVAMVCRLVDTEKNTCDTYRLLEYSKYGVLHTEYGFAFSRYWFLSIATATCSLRRKVPAPGSNQFKSWSALESMYFSSTMNSIQHTENFPWDSSCLPTMYEPNEPSTEFSIYATATSFRSNKRAYRRSHRRCHVPGWALLFNLGHFIGPDGPILN